MNINFNQPLVDLDGSQLELAIAACQLCGRSVESRPATLRGVCTDALMAVYRDESNLSGEEKIKRYDLASKITSENVVEIKPEELTLIRQLVAKMFGPRFMGPAWKLLDLKEET